MRDIPTVKAERDAASMRFAELQAEYDALIQARADEVIRRFDAGQDRGQIAREMRVNKNTVAGILWRADRTEKGRDALKQQVRAFVQAEHPGRV